MGLSDILDSIIRKITGKPELPDEQEVKRQAFQYVSREYKTFIEPPEEERGLNALFVKACKFSEKIIQLKAPASLTEKLNQAIITTDMDVTPDQVLSLTVSVILLGLVALIPLLILSVFDLLPSSSLLLLPFIPMMFAYFIFTYPTYYATVTKIRASDETVKVILYMIIYLRLNPQVEGAVSFAAAHCRGPIGKDLRKILWDLQTRKYTRIDQAIGSKMEKWLLWDKDFVESMNVIEGLSLETSEAAREKTLDKALTFILESTHEKMKEYSRDLRTPITLIHTMGITFPIMGLIMFPMISIFLHDTIDPIYLAAGYIVILPLFNFFYLQRTISKRPGAFSYPDISRHPDLPPEGQFSLKLGGKKYYFPVVPIALIVSIFIMLPGLVYMTNLAADWYSLQGMGEEGQLQWKERLQNAYKPDVTIGQMGYSLSIIWGIGAGLIIYTLGMSYQRLKIRNEIKMIEDEFQLGLFRLGDILSSGMPLESALDEAIEKYQQYKLQNSPMYNFFLGIRKNIRDMGMTLKRAIFDEQYGVIARYPSILVNDIMQIISSSAEKSAAILSVASKTISSFLMKTKRVEELLKEMLDEVSAAIQMQSSFIAPFICGIVAAMSTFIIQLLQKISEFLLSVEQTFNMGGFVQGSTIKFGEMMGLIRIEEVIPPTVFQLVVGIYMIELIVMLAYFLNGIKSGFDKTTRNVLIGKSMITALIFYTIIVYVGLFISATLLPSLGSLGAGITEGGMFGT